ncbi:hypothetical protein BT93_G0316 [Corymbia citriodora subsp. variegata]|nr:hypothetical protein BT93_G0316 [Corymbia citriodora subsp. variegata]
MAAGIRSMEFFFTQILLLLQQAIDGFGFSPTEEQLINHLKSEEPGCQGGFCIIPTLENINDFDPWDLPAKFREKSVIPSNDREWWFICPQTQMPRIPRRTPCGSSWKVTGVRIHIKIDGKNMGYKRILSFPPGGPGSEGGKSNWVIHEYHLLDEDLSRNYVLCHLMLKQDEKADNSTARSEHGAIDPADFAKLESCLNEPDDDGSFPEHLIQARMESLMEPSQHQNRVQLSLRDLLQLFQHGLQSLNNGLPSPINQFMNIGSPSVKDFSLDSKVTDKPSELESSLGTTKEDDWVDAMPNEDLFYAEVQKGEEPSLETVQQETAARNIKPCISMDETAARAKNGNVSVRENHQSKIEPLDGVVPLEETEGVIPRIFNSSPVSSAKPMELPEKPKTAMPESPRNYFHEEPRLEMLRK